MPEIRVDPTALEDLAHGLQKIRSTLASTKSATSISGESVGSELIVDRLHAFFDHWERGLRAMDLDLATVIPGLSQAAQAYRQTDQAIATGATVTP